MRLTCVWSISIKPEVIQRFVEEAQIGGQLQHPGIAPIYELGQFADKRPFFSMKLVQKGPDTLVFEGAGTGGVRVGAVENGVDSTRGAGKAGMRGAALPSDARRKGPDTLVFEGAGKGGVRVGVVENGVDSTRGAGKAGMRGAALPSDARKTR